MGDHIPTERAQALYDAAAALRQASPRWRAWPWPLFFMTDAARAPDPLAIAGALPAGAAVILRDYDAPDRPKLARALASICAERGVGFFVGADLDLAREIATTGVHLPERLHARIEETKRAHPFLCITAAAHSRAAARRAVEAGADAVMLSPAFPTLSHPGAPALGARAFCEIAGEVARPVIALGGVTPENATALSGAAAGLAAIGAFLD